MNAEKLYEAITLIGDDLIDEAAAYTPTKKKVIHWKRWTALAACLVLVVGVGGGVFLGMFGGRGGNSGVGAGGSGADGGSSFMSYAGPIFPLTSTSDTEGITAQRDITLDFAPWVPTWLTNEEQTARNTGLTEEEYQQSLARYNEWYPEGGRFETSDDILVTDTYTLSNSTAEDKTVSVLYPFVSSLMDLDSFRPELTVNGTQAETELICGLYSGGFQGVLGSDDPNGTANLSHPSTWTDYKALLSDGTYLKRAMGEPVDYSGIDVIVYEFTNAQGPEETKEIPNPSVRVTFDLDYDKTTVLSYGFHSGSFDPEAGKMGQGFSIPEAHSPNYGEPYCLIILGDDVENMEIEGFVTGGWDTENRLEEFHVDVTRSETDLDTILRRVVRYIYDNNSWQYGDSLAVDFETYYVLFCDHLASYGILAENGGAERYDTGWLSELSEVGAVDRVCYLETSITVPAGESITLSALMRKDASYDFYCAGTENQGVKGYETATELGSTLTFTGQTAALEDRGQIEIVRQNFGFDLSANIKSVELDPATEHYYLEVRRISDTESE